ncbi:hypothetical protein ACI797_22300 [Geodermatophilus sp. SYSU D00691]
MSQPPYPPQPGPWPPPSPYGHGPPPWDPWSGGVPGPPPRRSRATVVWVVVGSVLAVAVLVAVVVGARQLGAAQGDELFSPGAVATGEPAAPTGLGDDPYLDERAQACHDGTMHACDELYARSPSGSAYEQYGLTCGGRVKAYEVYACSDLGGTAVSTSPPSSPAGLGDDPGLDGYAQRCHDGLLDACDDLYQLSDPMSDYERYGITCGGRVAPYAVPYCTQLEDD